jgi:hypothetical protein
MAKRFDKATILAADDPIELLAAQAVDLMMDDSDFWTACQALVMRDMELPDGTLIGGDETDALEFKARYGWDGVLLETDPRHDLFWERLSAVMSQVFAQMIAGQKYRWYNNAPRGRHAAPAPTFGEEAS